ncbi:maltose acetyltransferase domain-containing protein [Escherichia coli]
MIAGELYLAGDVTLKRRSSAGQTAGHRYNHSAPEERD